MNWVEVFIYKTPFKHIFLILTLSKIKLKT